MESAYKAKLPGIGLAFQALQFCWNSSVLASCLDSSGMSKQSQQGKLSGTGKILVLSLGIDLLHLIEEMINNKLFPFANVPMCLSVYLPFCDQIV